MHTVYFLGRVFESHDYFPHKSRMCRGCLLFEGRGSLLLQECKDTWDICHFAWIVEVGIPQKTELMAQFQGCIISLGISATLHGLLK